MKQREHLKANLSIPTYPINRTTHGEPQGAFRFPVCGDAKIDFQVRDDCKEEQVALHTYACHL